MRTRRSRTGVAARRVRRARLRADARRRHPEALRHAARSPGTLQLLALCLVFGGLALTYDILFGFTGLLVVRPRPVRRGRRRTSANIAITEWHWSFWRRRSCSRRPSGSSLALVLGFVSPARRRHRVRDGDARVRTGRLGARAARIRTLDAAARRGSAPTTTKLPTAFVGVFNTKNLYWLALAYVGVVFLVIALGGRVVARPHLAGDPRERAARRGARAAAERVQADGVRARLVPRGARRDRLHAAQQRLRRAVTRRTSR